MATLYVENVPDELYDALRERAKLHHRSITAEVLALLEDNLPTEKELRRRADLLRKLDRLSASVKRVRGEFPSAEAMIREDRSR
jgi:plasmid stability protein